MKSSLFTIHWTWSEPEDLILHEDNRQILRNKLANNKKPPILVNKQHINDKNAPVVSSDLLLQFNGDRSMRGVPTMGPRVHEGVGRGGSMGDGDGASGGRGYSVCSTGPMMCQICHTTFSNMRHHLCSEHPGCARPWFNAMCGTIYGETSSMW